MNDSQSNRLDMYIVVYDFYIDNQATIDLVPARAAAFAQLDTNITAINTHIAGQSASTKGVTKDKAALRNTVDGITAAVLASAKAWAISVENNTLASEFDYAPSEIEELKDDTLQGFCDHRIQLVNDNLLAMVDHGIDATIVNAWKNALDAFVAMLEAPREAINSRHLHTVGLKTLYSDTAALFKDQIDPLMLMFKTTDPDIYAAYLQARIIINRKGQSGQKVAPDTIEIGAYIYNADTGVPIPGATMEVLNPPGTEIVSATTDEDGMLALKIIGFQPEQTVTLQFQVTATDFETIDGELEMTSGQLYTFDIPMDPTVLPPTEP